MLTQQKKRSKPKRPPQRKPKAAPVDACEDAPKPRKRLLRSSSPKSPEPKPEAEVTPERARLSPQEPDADPDVRNRPPPQPSQPAEVEPTPPRLRCRQHRLLKISCRAGNQAGAPYVPIGPQPFKVAPQAQPVKTAAKPKRRGWWSFGRQVPCPNARNN